VESVKPKRVIDVLEDVWLRPFMDGSADQDPLIHMRQRIEMCRRLSKSITDPEASRLLREMADQGEIDLQMLLNERQEKGSGKP